MPSCTVYDFIMLRNTILCSLFCLFAIDMQAQPDIRYKDLIFQEVRVDKDISYNPVTDGKDKKAYLFDLYQPQNDNVSKRPLIIWMHGGGFKFGSKADKNIQLWCKTFAQRGYVCASINYRNSTKNSLFNFDELVRACYYAVHDLKTAVAYFRANAAAYGIDGDRIVLAGNSAGGMIALQTAFSSDKELAGLAKITADSLDGNETNKPIKVLAVINFWGGIYNLDWLKNANVPIVCVLGDRDGVVPPTHKSAPLFGGVDIHEKADAIRLPNELKVFEGYSHELQKHFNPFFSGGKETQRRWLEAGQFAADFLFKNIFK